METTALPRKFKAGIARFSFLLLGIAACSVGQILATSEPTEPAAPLTPIATEAPVPPGAEGVVLQWTRVGGIAGFCDSMTISNTGHATLTSCHNPQLGGLAAPELFEDHWEELQGWLEGLAPYFDEQSDGAVADSMTVTLIFYGYGAAQATADDKRAIAEYASHVFFELSQPAAPAASCNVTANSDVTVYNRPSLVAQVFGILGVTCR